MAPEVIADEAHRRGDEAVRRMREESRRRIEERSRWRAFSSWCATATLAGGISIAALNAHDASLRRAAEDEAAARSAHVETVDQPPAWIQWRPKPEPRREARVVRRHTCGGDPAGGP